MPPLMTEMQSILDALLAHVRSNGDATAYTFLKSDDQRLSISFNELDERARDIAHALLQHAEPGERALLTYPSGLDFIEAFLGCLYAGIVAVPAYPPRKNRNAERILSIAQDCTPKLLLCTSETSRNVKGQFAESVSGASVIVTDELESTSNGSLPDIRSDQLAFLQYTSGSTAEPKGVMVTHGNIVANERLIQKYFEFTKESVIVSWLPMFHDMGLIGGVLAPLFNGFPAALMAPNTFLQEPFKWLHTITEFQATCSGAPNFAYDLCVRKITVEQKQQLDLSSVRVAYNGAEPVRRETLQRFSRAFAQCGFKMEAFFPCYGMAETTLLVSGGPPLIPKNVVTVNSVELEQHRIADDTDGQPIVSCGQIGPDLDVRVVDPHTCTECEVDHVGEIWVRGGSIAMGYWNQPKATRESFHAKLHDDAHWFRTGDYGFVRRNELYVTGRLKDLIIIRGRNIYPQDIENLVEHHLGFLEPNSCAAFSIEGTGEERLLVVAEGTRDMVRWAKQPSEMNREVADLKRVTDRLKADILDHFDVALSELKFVRPTKFPRTSSGKVQRRIARLMASDSNGETILRLYGATVQDHARRLSHPDKISRSFHSDPGSGSVSHTRQIVRSVVQDWLRTNV